MIKNPVETFLDELEHLIQTSQQTSEDLDRLRSHLLLNLRQNSVIPEGSSPNGVADILHQLELLVHMQQAVQMCAAYNQQLYSRK